MFFVLKLLLSLYSFLFLDMDSGTDAEDVMRDANRNDTDFLTSGEEYM